ncbi:hypothetical protein FB645_001445 [Coemansia sp. IMI 203386]|nr:hypothetical protein FB645_001445 [Coemansia sp. IMI 203386]
MIVVFLVDTSVSMEQELGGSALAPSTKRDDEDAAEESLFGGQRGGVNRRWQRKGAGPGSAAAGVHRTTRLDCAKSIVEQIVTNRQSFEQDRYMLVTYGGGAGGCIRANVKDSRATLLAEVRRLEATDRFYGGVALAAVFNQLTLMRGAYDLDTYGYGRYPTLSEAVHIVWLTDGASVVTATGVHNKLNLPVNSTPWAEAYTEPFRWDQRLSLVLLHELGDAQLCTGRPHSSESTVLPMSSVMGGAVHHVGSMHQAQRFVEAFAPARAAPGSARSQGAVAAAPGVLVNFERIDDNPANPGNSDLRVLLHAAPCPVATSGLPPPVDSAVQPPGYGNSAGVSALINGQLGYFPIPEAFWPEAISAPQQHAGAWQVPRRSAHPTLGYSQAGAEWAVPPQFPFDKYQIDSGSNVAQKLLAATQAAQAAHDAHGGKGAAKPVCWPVFVNGSYSTPKNAGFPFGILRANTARTAVNLYVLPYNFAALWKILAKLDMQAPGQPPARAAVAMTPAWRRELDEYLQHTPGYYAIPLKRAFNLYGVPHGVFPKSFGQSPGMRAITHYSLRLHTLSRKDWDRLPPSGSVAAIGAAASLQHALLAFTPASDAAHLAANAFDVDRAHCLPTLSAMRRVFVRECMSAHAASFRTNAIAPPAPVDCSLYALSLQLEPAAEHSPLGGLVDVASDDDRDSRHSVPIRAMGVFGAAMHRLKLHEPRDPLQDERVALQQRRNMFGNPYRRPVREPRGPANNVLARSPELSAKLGLSRPQPKTPGVPASAGAAAAAGGNGAANGSVSGGGSPQPRVESDDDAAAGLEMEGEAEVNEFAIDKMIEDLPMGSEEPAADGSADGTDNPRGRNTGGKFWWLQRRDVPRRRSINAPWRKNDSSWNVNPWATRVPSDASSDRVAEPGTMTYTADAVIFHKGGSQTVKAPATAAAPSSTPPSASLPADTPTPVAISATGLDSLPARPRSPRPAPDAELLTQDQPTALSDGSDSGGTSPTDPQAESVLNRDAEAAENASSAATDSAMAVDTAATDDATVAVVGAVDATQPLSEGDRVAAAATVTTLPREPPSLPYVLPTPPSPSSLTSSSPSSPSLPAARRVNVAEEKAWFMKRIKADPAHYDEDVVLQRLVELQSNPALGKSQLKIIVTTAIMAAKAMRRKQLVARLEEKAATSR